MKLTSSNCSVDKNSGAVIIHKSPELVELTKLKSEIKDIQNKLDTILQLLQGDKNHDKTMD